VPEESLSQRTRAEFKYLTPRLRLSAEDLTADLLTSKSFHLICSPQRCIELVEGIVEKRQALDRQLARPLFIWEPVPDLCVPAALEDTINALRFVDVVSPNHAEFAGLFDVSGTTQSGDVERAVMEDCCRKLTSSIDLSRRLDIVVRAGKDGCCVFSRTDHDKIQWLPAYHSQNQSAVVDPTGGGNGFLGGFAVGLVRTKDAVEAAIWASVSASLCIEQVGMPILGHSSTGDETWNGVVVGDRLHEFKQRCRQ